MTDPIVIGVDIGGSHIAAMGVDILRKRLLHSVISRRKVNCHDPAGSILANWAEALGEVVALIPGGVVQGIGFAMPGPFDYPGGVAHFKGVKKYDTLNNINIREEISRRLDVPGTIPIRFLNDATCFAIGEAWMGPASRYQRSVAITLGTGFGSAFLDNGIPVEGGDEIPESGCVYHLPFGESIADDYFSSRWFKKSYRDRFSEESSGGREMSEEALTDPAVREIYTEFGQNLGNFLVPWLVRFHAGCLTIGGNISRGYELFEEPFKAALRSHQCAARIFISTLGENAAIAGSARLCDNSFYSKLPFISNK